MSEIVFRGYLHKSPPESFGSTLKPWRQRWFVLADSRLAFPFATPYVRLEYYTNEQFANELDEPKGIIDLKDCTSVADRHPMRGHDHVFDLCTDKRAYHFAAPSMEIKSVWMESLNAVLRNNTKSLQQGVLLRMGTGSNAGDICVESPIYSSFQCSINASENKPEQTEAHLSMQTSEREPNKELSPKLLQVLANATYLDDDLQDDYQCLQHKKPNDVNPPPVEPGTSGNYGSLARPFLQDNNDVDDYQHLDHKKHQQGDYAATATTNTSLYSRLNGTDVYHHLNRQHLGSTVSAAVKSPTYSSLGLVNATDDYQHLGNCSLRPSSQANNEQTEYAIVNHTLWRAPRVPAIPARKRVPAVPARKHVHENTNHSTST